MWPGPFWKRRDCKAPSQVAPFFSLKPYEKRRRSYIFFPAGEKAAGHSYSKLAIEGSVFRAESYREEAALEFPATRNDYRYGHEVEMELVGNVRGYLVKGWAPQMARYCWSIDREATLRLTVPSPAADLKLELSLDANVDKDRLPRQRIELLVNDRLAARWVVEQRGKHRIQATIPREWIDSSKLEISFLLPDAASPKSLGFGQICAGWALPLYSFKRAEENGSGNDND